MKKKLFSLLLIIVSYDSKKELMMKKDQLENTIKLITKHNDISTIKYKKAYACNKKHPYFQVIESERKKRFYDKTGFRIDAQVEIKIE